MSLYLDRRFVAEISSHLNLFKQRKDDLWSFRCPFCGDSQKKKTKTRGYIYRKDNGYFFKCHNCEYGTTLGGLIRYLDPMKYRQYALEKFRNETILTPIKSEIKFTNEPVLFHSEINLPTIEQLPEQHYAKEYVKGRIIPIERYSSLYYAHSFKLFVDSILQEHDYELIDDDPRIVIPFYNEQKQLIGLQGRALKNNKIRYITIKIGESQLKVFGLDKLDKTKDINVLEGPIDSMFIDNSIAVCDSSLSSAAKYLSKENLVLIFDKQYHNPEIKKQIEKSIEEGFRVCLFPKSLKGKDVNDFIINGISKEKLNQIKEENTFHGMRAIMEFNKLKG